MKIGIDAREACNSKSGKGHYVEILLKALARLDSQNQYLLYTSQDFSLDLPGNFTKRVIKSPSIFWHLSVLAAKRRDGVDLFVAPTSYIIPALTDGSVVVVHDLVSFLNLVKHQPKAQWIEQHTLPRALAKAKKIVAISYSTKKDLINHFPIEEKKVTVIHNAESYIFREIKDQLAIRTAIKKHKLPDRFMLTVGTLEPRKNLVNLLQAYARAEISPALVVVGGKGWYYDEIFRTVEKLKLQSKVIFLGQVEREELVYLYNAAEFLVFPSLYEGFGFPPLEAMMCGLPVLTSKASSLSEVCGHAALYVNPRSIREIEKGIERLNQDYKLREYLRQQGHEQSKKFSQEKMARSYIDLFNQLNNEK